MGSIVLGSYYPETSEGRAEWWENIQEHGEALLKKLGFPPERIAAVMADAAWGVYTYGTLRNAADDFTARVASFANAVSAGVAVEGDDQLPSPPLPPQPPQPPRAEITSDFEHRRVEWVAEAKESPAYTSDLGQALGIELPTNFNSGSYKAEIYGLLCSSPKTVTGKFRKAHGSIEGIVLRGRRMGSALWVELGRFKATPFSAPVPVTGPDAEEWEFQGRALKRDIEVGVPSDIAGAMIKG
jgi:hypothetical protein